MSGPVRVLHVITTLDTGGAETMLAKLLAAMDARAFESRVVSMVPPGSVGRVIERLGIEVGSLGMRRGVPSVRGWSGLVRLIRRWRPDVVQTWMYHADLIGLLAAKGAGNVPVVWNVRCSDMHLGHYRLTTRLTVGACRLLSPFPQAVVLNSETARRYHLRLGYRPRQTAVIPNGFDLGRFKPGPERRRAAREELGLDDQALIVGHVARFDPMKDHRSFFQAADRVHRTFPEVHFLLCGEGVNSANPVMAGFLARARFPHRFHLLGRRSDVERLMAALDVFVSSSAWGEGFPNVLGEAMASGVPCVATDVGDSAMIVGKTGEVVKPGMPRLLAEGIESILNLPDEGRRRLAAAARRRIAERFAIERIAESYQTLYRSVAPR